MVHLVQENVKTVRATSIHMVLWTMRLQHKEKGREAKGTGRAFGDWFIMRAIYSPRLEGIDTCTAIVLKAE